MATTFSWSIDRMSTFQEPQPNYVAEVCWSLMGVNSIGTGENQTYQAIIGGRTTLVSTESTFIPYDQLTEEIVIGWLHNTLGVDGVNSAKAQIQSTLDKNMNPPSTVPLDTPLPWAQE